MKIFKVVTLGALVLLTSSCASVQSHRDGIRDDSGDRVTVGTVQKEIRVGMSGSDVVSALGSPNIVSTDSERREVWVYDKIATETVHSSTAGGFNILVLGFADRAGAQSTSQRTLTVIVKFDKNGLVRDFAYHTSRF